MRGVWCEDSKWCVVCSVWHGVLNVCVLCGVWQCVFCMVMW
jgi:hypothetical protein